MELSLPQGVVREGSRVVVLYKGKRRPGVARFIGRTEFRPDVPVWVGVELEERAGTHDGCVDGTRYFRAGEARGVFVQPVRVKQVEEGSAARSRAPLACSSSSRSLPAGVVGLKNLGNTCFFNSVVCALAHTHSFVARVLGPDARRGGPLTRALQAFLGEVWSGAARRVVARPPLDPGALFGAVCRRAPQFGGRQQHDAVELLKYLLDLVHCEQAKRADGFSDVADTFGGELRSTVTCGSCKRRSSVGEDFCELSLPIPRECLARREKEAVGGRPAGRGRRTAGRGGGVAPAPRFVAGEGAAAGPARPFPVRLPDLPGAKARAGETSSLVERRAAEDRAEERSKADRTVRACLEHFTRPELIEGYRCEGCGEGAAPGPASRRYELSRLPRSLILTLKRFAQTRSGLRKLSSRIATTAELDVAPFCAPPPEGMLPPDARYRLGGVVVHSGSIVGGHYSAYVRAGGGGGDDDGGDAKGDEGAAAQWFYVSDSTVRETTEREVLQREAYICVYNRLDDDPQ